MNSHSCRAFVYVGMLLVLAGAAGGNVAISPVAITGRPAAGLEQGTVYTILYTINLNDSGQVAISGQAGANSISGRFALWTGRPDDLRLVAMDGQQAPGLPAGVVLDSMFLNQEVPITPDGRVVFPSEVFGPDVTDVTRHALFVGGPGAVTLVAREGDPAPDIPGANYQFVLYGGFGSDGSLVYGSSYGPSPTQNDGIGTWIGPVSAPLLAVRTGQPAPETPAGSTFLGSSAVGRSVNSKGQIVVGSAIMPPSGVFDQDYGAWIGHIGDLHLVYRTKTHAAGTADNVVWSSDADFNGGTIGTGYPLYIDEAGNTAFFSFLRGPGVDETNREGIWYGGPGTVRLVARSGTQAPGLPAGVKIGRPIELVPGSGYFFSLGNLKHNRYGEISLLVGLNGDGVSAANNEALLAGASDDLRLIARKGDHAPGTAEGVVFDRAARTPNSIYVPFDLSVLGDSGQVAFLAGLSGPGISDGNHFGMWATDPTGKLILVAREGDLLDVGNGELRTVEFLTPRSFNAAGQLGFIAEFTDGSNGAFIASIPEPGALLFFVPMVILARRATKNCY